MGPFITYVVIMILCLLGGCAYTEFACSSKAEKMGFKSDYGPVQGCMIKVDKAWIPIESYRTIGNVD